MQLFKNIIEIIYKSFQKDEIINFVDTVKKEESLSKKKYGEYMHPDARVSKFIEANKIRLSSY